jgi:tetrapyrrole methylase family protein/MazG family protein
VWHLFLAQLRHLPTLTKEVMVEQDLDSFATLVYLVSRLRAQDGCPWDREQTHISIKPFLIEEAYEVVQALDREEPAKLCEELGDLLLQIALHAQIAAEAGEFDIGQVLSSINSKIIRRHPHVFGELEVKDAREVLLSWETLKQEERGKDVSILSSVPDNMPTLAYSQAIQQRAARVGFDWKELKGILDKLTEELEELEQAKDQQQKVREFGDILFALANAARWLGVDLEAALRQANERFRERFAYMEQACQRRGVAMQELSLEQLDELWEEAKKKG